MPQSNPGTANIRCSPARQTSDRVNGLERVMTSSALSSGTTFLAPLLMATAIDVDARSTSTTATTRPDNCAGVSCDGPKITSMRIHGSRSKSLSRSRNFVSTCPAWNRGFAITRLRKGMVVVTPSTMNPSSAICIRLTASGRSRP